MKDQYLFHQGVSNHHLSKVKNLSGETKNSLLLKKRELPTRAMNYLSI
jgi:hypothetical protein